MGLQQGARLISPKGAGQSRGRPCYTSLLSAGGCGDGLLELLAADLAGAGLQEQVMAGVADQHWVIQLLVRDGQLQMTTVFTEHIATVPAVVTSLCHPELTVTVETMGGHVVGHPPRDLCVLGLHSIPAALRQTVLTVCRQRILLVTVV